MTGHVRERSKNKRSLMVAVVIGAFSIVSLPAVGQQKVSDKSNGCTMAQIQLPETKQCVDQIGQDLMAKRSKSHILVCGIAGDIRCCVEDGPGKFSGCGPRLNAAVLVCGALKAEKGVWAADPKTVKANSDKKTCSQTYTCGPPAQLTADQKKCAPVISSSNKTVAQTGTCVPGSAPGTCSSCLTKPPNDPCVVTFRQ